MTVIAPRSYEGREPDRQVKGADIICQCWFIIDVTVSAVIEAEIDEEAN